jgi:uncharacterized protein YndB with AHSA1/START domain
MSKRSVVHATFVIERLLDAAPKRVFAAWADPVAKSKWFKGPEQWGRFEHSLDFRVGGREINRGGPQQGPVHVFEAHYQDIVPGERIAYTYTMHMDATLISISLATIEFAAAGTGTRLKLTEQGAFLDGFDDAGQREHGTRELLDKLEAALRREGALS